MTDKIETTTSTASGNLIAGDLKSQFEGHTPGPWEALPWEKQNGGTDWNVWGPAPSNHIGHDYLWGDYGNEADARLIAAAPDLLAAVERKDAEIARLREALAVVSLNARLIPDPQMNGTTDCFAIPCEDIDMIRSRLASSSETDK